MEFGAQTGLLKNLTDVFVMFDKSGVLFQSSVYAVA